MANTHNNALIDALQDATLYNHPVEYFKLIETHISWVILTGPYAYKIKKPVNFGFLDFSTLDKRRFYCDEEVRLNRRLAPELYIASIAITGSVNKPHLNGEGPVLDYAVKMVQFNPDDQLDHLLARDELTTTHIDELTTLIAEFHDTIAVAGMDKAFGTPEHTWQPIVENFEQIGPLLTEPHDTEQLQRLQDWFEKRYEALIGTLSARKENGFIRECHGDMHLANITLYKNKITAFDCLEFNDNLHWIDVISEAAFLKMDLDEHKRSDLGNRFLNNYLQQTGDYDGLNVLDYYLTYRAMVRAKVARIQHAQCKEDEKLSTTLQQQYHAYMALAEHYTQPKPVALIITHGLSGSGKTWQTQSLIEKTGAIRIRSDVERKRLHGIAARQQSHSNITGGIYSASASERTYDRLAELANIITTAGYPVIVDATFLNQARRTDFHNVARQHNVPFIILDFQAPESVLRERIQQRQSERVDESEADIKVLQHQLQTQEPLTKEELDDTIVIDSEQTMNVDAIISKIINHQK